MEHDASQRKKHLFFLKSNTEHCFDSALYRTIYCCIVIHQRQYIDMSTHCIVATLVVTHVPINGHISQEKKTNRAAAGLG